MPPMILSRRPSWWRSASAAAMTRISPAPGPGSMASRPGSSAGVGGRRYGSSAPSPAPGSTRSLTRWPSRSPMRVSGGRMPGGCTAAERGRWRGCPPPLWQRHARMATASRSLALDLIGERWALLVVRELLLGPKRYTDLRRGLPTASPNVLSERLRELEDARVIRRHKLPPPASSRVYELTEWGHE